MNVQVSDLTGRYAITLEDGQALLEQLQPALERGEAIELDFANVDVLASPFFNAAIGQLVEHFDAQTLSQLLKIRNLSPNAESLLQRVITNATQYYSEENMRTQLDRILDDQTGRD